VGIRVIFGWKKPATKPRAAGEWAEPLRKLRFFPDDLSGAIAFDRVTLPPAIQELSLRIPAGSWVQLYGSDDFAKALFCDLCFSYILPESGKVSPGLRGGDVSFLGRSSTTYGRSLVDHLGCGVREKTRELTEFTVRHVLSDRFRRHVREGTLEFLEGRAAHDVDLDERDYLEIAEANLLLQRRKAAVIDTTTDFYQIALEQGFRHSDVFLNSGKTLLWIIAENQPLPAEAQYWKLPAYRDINKVSLSFPNDERAGFLN
jgi:hypothetical protein